MASLKEPRPSTTLLFAIQWLVVGLAVVVATPVALGPILGLTDPEVAALVQRSMLVSGIATFLQTAFGHRMPIQEGPAGIWIGVILVLVAGAPAAGKDLAGLRAEIQLGLIAAGMLMLVLGAFGLVRRLAALLTPTVTGAYLLLVAIQVSGPFLRGMAGDGYRGGGPSPRVFLLSLVTLTSVVGCAQFGRGLVRSLAVLIGVLSGWLLFVATGTGGLPGAVGGPVLSVPRWFEWGAPALDPGVVLISLITGMLALINLYGAMAAMSGVTGKEPAPADYDRGGLAMGAGHVLSGVGATGGIIVMTHSAALVGLMGSGSIGSLRLAGAAMTLLGLMPPVAAFFGAVPAPVGYAALFALFSQVAVLGLQGLARGMAAPGGTTVAGLSLLAGTAVMLLPQEVLLALPPMLRPLLGNGLAVGTICAVLLEAVLMRSGRSH